MLRQRPHLLLSHTPHCVRLLYSQKSPQNVVKESLKNKEPHIRVFLAWKMDCYEFDFPILRGFMGLQMFINNIVPLPQLGCPLKNVGWCSAMGINLPAIILSLFTCMSDPPFVMAIGHG